jgi:DNA-binding NtrC family response regulator
MTDGQKHLLIVDDETPLREAIAERLADQGFLVEQAGSGEQALERLAGFAFDILITDLRLPGIDGRQVLDGAIERYPDIIAIVITGYGTVKDAVDAITSSARRSSSGGCDPRTPTSARSSSSGIESTASSAPAA